MQYAYFCFMVIHIYSTLSNNAFGYQHILTCVSCLYLKVDSFLMNTMLKVFILLTISTLRLLVQFMLLIKKKGFHFGRKRLSKTYIFEWWLFKIYDEPYYNLCDFIANKPDNIWKILRCYYVMVILWYFKNITDIQASQYFDVITSLRYHNASKILLIFMTLLVKWHLGLRRAMRLCYAMWHALKIPYDLSLRIHESKYIPEYSYNWLCYAIFWDGLHGVHLSS